MERQSSDPNVGEELIGSVTTAGEIVDTLAKRGCSDLTSSINFGACSDFPCAGGGFCDVYRGVLHDGTRIAIKSLRIYDGPEAEGDNEKRKVLKRAARELYHWSKLQHCNVLPLMGLATFRGQISMISEWMDHGNLMSFLRLNPDANRNRLCMDVCEGLCHIHMSEMVHGDLKAANVMVSPNGTAMIADFGNAQLKDLTLRFSTTANGGFSIRWAAPELLLADGGPQVSKEADVYAYGMTILEALTGKVPYEGVSDNRILILVAVDKKVPSRPNDGMGDELWDLLNSCWTQEPSERPEIASVRDSLQALFWPDSDTESSESSTYHSASSSMSSEREVLRTIGNAHPPSQLPTTRKLRSGFRHASSAPSASSPLPRSQRPQPPPQPQSKAPMHSRNFADPPGLHSKTPVSSRRTHGGFDEGTTPGGSGLWKDWGLRVLKFPPQESPRNSPRAKETTLVIPVAPESSGNKTDFLNRVGQLLTQNTPGPLPSFDLPKAPWNQPPKVVRPEPSVSFDSPVRANHLDGDNDPLSSNRSHTHPRAMAISSSHTQPLPASQAGTSASTCPVPSPGDVLKNLSRSTDLDHPQISNSQDGTRSLQSVGAPANSSSAIQPPYFMNQCQSEVLAWTSQDPRNSCLFMPRWGVLYRFTTENTPGRMVTTLHRAIRQGREDLVARLEWALNGGLGRAVIGRQIIPMADLVRPDSDYGSRTFNGPDGYQYKWCQSKENQDLGLMDFKGNLIAFYRPVRVRRYDVGDVYGEMHFVTDAGAGTMLYPPLMDMLCVTALLYRLVIMYNL